LDLFLEEFLYDVNQRIVSPVDFSRHHAEVDFAVVFAVELAMDINMQDGFVWVFECPVLEGLVEGVFVEHFGEEVVGVEFLLIE
jgi:hypothetical protein